MKPKYTTEALRDEILYEWLVHDEDCNYSLTDQERCTCIQKNVVDNIMPLFTAQLQALIEEIGRRVIPENWEEIDAVDKAINRLLSAQRQNLNKIREEKL